MVIITLTKPVSEEFECEVVNVPPGSNKKDLALVRPCERYKELYQSCKAFRSRLYQYYVYGEKNNCDPHYNNYNNCLKYRKSQDLNYLESIVEWEKDLMNTRLKTMEQNKTWEYRTAPPADFDGPLPEFIKKRQSGSILPKSKKSNES